MSLRHEIFGIVVGSVLSCALLAVLILHVLPREGVSIEVLPEGSYLPSKSGTASEAPRRA